MALGLFKDSRFVKPFVPFVTAVRIIEALKCVLGQLEGGMGQRGRGGDVARNGNLM